MPDGYGERLARAEERLAEMRREFDSHVRDGDARSDRVRELEAAMGVLIEAHKQARRDEDNQYRRLELRIQWLTLVIGAAALVVPVVVAIVASGG